MVLDKNPLKDLRVRMALSLAINRQAIVERVMENAAIPTDQYLRPGSYSYVQDLPPHPFLPDQAKALLAEAGFPNGLRVTIHGPNDRYAERCEDHPGGGADVAADRRANHGRGVALEQFCQSRR